MAHLIGGENLHLEYPTKTVFDAVSIGIDQGDRIGIVGRNGDGKSTLMRLLAGRIDPDGGRVTVRSGTTVGMLDQADTLDPNQTVGHAVVGDVPDHVWASDAKVRDVISGLVSDVDWDTDISELSGGQRRRVALAGLLAQDWDVIFLDEPTNHLDVDGITWLAQHLNNRWSKNSGALVVVTHDRWFLDAVCTDTWEVHDRMVEPFEGGYAAYVLQRVERDRQNAVIEQKRQNLMRKELAWLRRGAPARTSKPKFRIDAANQLISDVPPPRDSVSLSRMAVSRLGKDVVDIEDVSVSFEGGNATTHVLKDVTWLIAPGERTGILGVNGAGKSTLLGLVTGAVSPTSGRVKRGKTVKISTLTQQLAELDDVANDRVSDVVASKKTSYVTEGKEMSPTQLLERLGFTSAQLKTPVKDLSGGQKRRLQLLMILLDEPNVLILDEPSNDLDTDMLAAMEDLLDTWPGTLLVVSHDRYLLERVTDQQYAVINGQFRHLPGGVEEYLKLSASSSSGSAAGSAGASNPLAAGSSSGSDDAVASASEPTLSGAEARAAQKELGAVERKLQKLTKEAAALDETMAAADPSDFEGLGTLAAQKSELQEQMDELEMRWLELGEALE
ncbi:ABC-F family ATP-binding cassette domain-containing protein [Kocuria sp. cx-116]|uniref:ABC-F family ATP-binding cassette domain-containing protein n=1 Tax=Kocuria sp. cx-116 TaxID=2771378 RepID=UPI001681D734|nr:ABC-F family ATP-binding cassette domain-containing protein [Kocuria sp. cx-116]MBD2762723.1 ABC-F family ATP-binding cassette domain-containing protein [Kocuria sp. cx-116]